MRSTIDEKIEELVQWNAKYPNIEIDSKEAERMLMENYTTEEEFELAKEYEKMQKYYNYIKKRNYCKKLTKEQVHRCKEGGVRGVFGYPEQIEKFGEKYGIKQKKYLILYLRINMD